MRTVALLVISILLASACGSDQPPVDGTEQSVDEAGPDDGTEQPDEAEAEAPTISPGDVSMGMVTVEGTIIDYMAVTPAGFEPGDTVPLLLAMPPGGQTLALTKSVLSSVYAGEALARGWVVVSPVAPDGELYFQGSERLIPGFLDWVSTWVTAEGGGPHLAGISNGGLSSFRVAANQPERFRSIVAFPGYARSDEDKAALTQLTDIPIRLYVGSTDSGWVGPMEETFATLDDLGGDVTLDIRQGEGHVMASLSDGVEIFDQLDAAR